MTQGEALLAVQDLDTQLDQLHHRRGNLPEHAALTELQATLRTLGGERAGVAATRDELAARQAALEADTETVERRIAEIEQRLYSGTVTASRDLQSMSEEVDHLKARRSALEDETLEVLEAREPVDAELARFDDRAGQLLAERSRLEAVIAERQAEIDVELATAADRRTEVAAGVDATLLARYEQLRSKLGGTGAARLVAGSCTGCHLSLPATELDRIKRLPPDELATCEQCGRILVP